MARPFLGKGKSEQCLYRPLNLQQRRLLMGPPLLLVAVLVVFITAVSSWFVISLCGFSKLWQNTPNFEFELVESRGKEIASPKEANKTLETSIYFSLVNSSQSDLKEVAPKAKETFVPTAPATKENAKGNVAMGKVEIHKDLWKSGSHFGPYHNWELFALEFQEMLQKFRIFVYPDVFNNDSSSPFANIFLPHPNPFDSKVGNYFSEHMFKVALLRSSLVTSHPEDAHFFFLPFSINALRNDPHVHSEASISDFVTQYIKRISWEFKFWNASRGTNHFYVCCHSVCRDAASKHHDLHNNAIQVTCSSSYFQRFYIAHRDVGLPQVWPRLHEEVLNPPKARHKLVFFAGRMQNSRIRQQLIALWGNDSSMDVFSGSTSFPYEEGFRRSKFCLHVKGYEVNTARLSDAINFGCIPVIISNYYDLPFANVLDWSKFSVIISEKDIALLKKILLSISRQAYLGMYHNLTLVRRHFIWHTTPKGYDSFHMTAYQLWLRRGI